MIRVLTSRILLVTLGWLLMLALGIPSSPAAASDNFTGLLIVVQGFHLDRSMSPAVISVGGTVVYGRGWWKPGSLDQEFVNKYGVVGYPPSTSAARRAGPNPLVVNALGVAGPALSSIKTDVVISEEDARRIQAANSQAKFLDRYLVDIVLLR